MLADSNKGNNELFDFVQSLKQCQSFVSNQLTNGSDNVDWKSIEQQLASVSSIIQQSTSTESSVHSVTNEPFVERLGNFDSFFRLEDIVYNIVSFFNRMERRDLSYVSSVFYHCVRRIPVATTHMNLDVEEVNYAFVKYPMTFEHLTKLSGRASPWSERTRYYDSDSEDEEPEMSKICTENAALLNTEYQKRNFDTVFLEAISAKNLFAPINSKLSYLDEVNTRITSIDAIIPRQLETTIARLCPNLTQATLLSPSSLHQFPNLTSVELFTTGMGDATDDFPFMQHLRKLIIFESLLSHESVVKNICASCPNLEELLLSENFERSPRPSRFAPNDDVVNNDVMPALPKNLTTLGLPYLTPLFYNVSGLKTLKISYGFFYMREQLTSSRFPEVVSNSSSTLETLAIPWDLIESTSTYRVELPKSLVRLEISCLDPVDVNLNTLENILKIRDTLQHLHFRIDVRYRRSESRATHTWKLPGFSNLQSLTIVAADIDYRDFPKLRALKLYGNRAVCNITSDSLEYIDLSEASIYNVVLNTPKLSGFKPPKCLLTLEVIRTGTVQLNLRNADQFYSMRIDKSQSITAIKLGLSTCVLPNLNYSTLKVLHLPLQAGKLLPACTYPNIETLGIQMDSTRRRARYAAAHQVVPAEDVLSLLSHFPNVINLNVIRTIIDHTVTRATQLFPSVICLNCTDALIDSIIHCFPSVTEVKYHDPQGEIERLYAKQIKKFTGGIRRTCNFSDWIQLESLCLVETASQGVYRFDDQQYLRTSSVSTIASPCLKHLALNNVHDAVTIDCPELISVSLNFSRCNYQRSTALDTIVRGCKKLEYVDIGIIDDSQVSIPRRRKRKASPRKDDYSDSSSSSDDRSPKRPRRDYRRDYDRRDYSRREQYFIGDPKRRNRSFRSRSRSRSPPRRSDSPFLHRRTSPKRDNNSEHCSLFDTLVNLAERNPNLLVVSAYGSLQSDILAQLFQMHQEFSSRFPNVLFSYQNSML